MNIFRLERRFSDNVKVSACEGKEVIGTEERYAENWASSSPRVYYLDTVWHGV